MSMQFYAPQYKNEPKELHPHQLTDIGQIRNFIFAGNATVTLVSKKTGSRFTYRINKTPNDGGVVSHFVALMNGPDNEKSFQYIGHVYRDTKHYVHGKKSKIAFETPSARAIDWFLNQVEVGWLNPDLEVWHEGRCGKCNRKLTVPTSIALGIGPECAKHGGLS